MIAAQVGGKVVRDSFFLSAFDVAKLPYMVAGAAIGSVLAALLASRAMTRFGPNRVVPAAFYLSTLFFLGEWWLAINYPKVTAVLVFLHIAVFGSFLISGFWMLISERFDPRTARKRMGRIASGTTVGGLVGGFLTERMAIRSPFMSPVRKGQTTEHHKQTAARSA